ncbi:MAG: hypothetical protein IPG96_19240 [Proteobacteria bacterium]|nr:hypothetical protein [Pseudomonadota bacterium]
MNTSAPAPTATGSPAAPAALATAPTVAPTPTPLRRAVGEGLKLFVIWRGALLVLAFVAANVTYQREGARPPVLPDHWFLSAHVRSDSLWYAEIAERGYYAANGESNAAFFPLYPYLVRWLTPLTGNVYLTGLLLSNLSTALALVFLFAIGLELVGREQTRRALVYLLVYPSSYFLGAFYTEGLFLLTSASSFYFFLRRRYLLAGLCGLLAGLTRSAGLPLFLGYGATLAWQQLQEHRAGRRPRFEWGSLWLTLTLGSYPVFMLILQRQVGDPLAFARYLGNWNRAATAPWVAVARDWRRIDFSFAQRHDTNLHRVLEMAATLGMLGLGSTMALRGMHPALWSYTLLSVLFPLSTGTVRSMLRYTGVVFPGFFGLAGLARGRTAERLIIFGFGFILATYYLRFVNAWFTG